MTRTVRRRCLATLLAVACRPTAAPPAAATTTPPTVSHDVALPDAKDVLAQAVEAAGGAAAHEALHSYYLESRMDLPQQGLRGDTKLWWKDGKFHLEVVMQGVGPSSIWYDGTAVVAEDPFSGRRTLAEKEARQARWATSVSLAHDWADYFATARTIARREHDGRGFVDVVLAADDGSELLMSFDATTHLLASQRFSQVSPMGELPVEIVMLEYRTLGALQYAVRTQTITSVVTADNEVTKFEPNVEIDDAQFSPPAPPAAPASELDDGATGKAADAPAPRTRKR